MLSAISLEHTGTSILLACSKPCGMILSLFNHRNVRRGDISHQKAKWYSVR
jgi:hypothetical protein